MEVRNRRIDALGLFCCALVLSLLITNAAMADLAKIHRVQGVDEGSQYFICFVYRTSKLPNASPFVAIAWAKEEGGAALAWQGSVSLTDNSRRGRLLEDVSDGVLDELARTALVGRGGMLIVHVGSQAYLKSWEAKQNWKAAAGGTKTARELMSGLLDVVTESAGLDVPPQDSEIHARMRRLEELSTKDVRQPTQVRWEPAGILPSAKASSEPSVPIAVSPTLSISPDALKLFYQAIAEAEDNPGTYMNVLANFESNLLRDISVHRVTMRIDPGIPLGDSLCVYSSRPSMTPFPEIATWLTDILNLKEKKPDVILSSFGISANHPMLGVPQTWVALVEAKPLCYFAHSSLELLASAPYTAGIRYFATLILPTHSPYPSDPPPFNLRDPVSVSEVTSQTEELTTGEAAWRRHRARVLQFKRIADTRTTAYGNLAQADIRVRRAYVSRVRIASTIARQFRNDFARREIAWDKYRQNRNIDLAGQALAVFNRGVTRFSEIAQMNSNIHGGVSFAEYFDAHTKTYGTFAASPLFQYASSTAQYDPKLTIRGPECHAVLGLCGNALRQSSNEGKRNGASWQDFVVTFGGVEQSKYDHILDVGLVRKKTDAFDLAPFGADPTGGICRTRDVSPEQLDRKYVLRVTNKSDLPRNLSLVTVGTRIRASWGDDLAGVSIRTVESKTSIDLAIQFEPGTGYEDLNLVTIWENDNILFTIALDYSELDAPAQKIVEYTGNNRSGEKKEFRDFIVGITRGPLGYKLAKACFSLTGDRPVCGKWSRCDWESEVGDELTVRFSLQGHEDDKPGIEYSQPHLKAIYRFDRQAAKLR